jgi:hypothetical protein
MIDLTSVWLVRYKDGRHEVHDGAAIVNSGRRPVDRRFQERVYEQMLERGYVPTTSGGVTHFVGPVPVVGPVLRAVLAVGDPPQ